MEVQCVHMCQILMNPAASQQKDKQNHNLRSCTFLTRSLASGGTSATAERMRAINSSPKEM